MHPLGIPVNVVADFIGGSDGVQRHPRIRRAKQFRRRVLDLVIRAGNRVPSQMYRAVHRNRQEDLVDREFLDVQVPRPVASDRVAREVVPEAGRDPVFACRQEIECEHPCCCRGFPEPVRPVRPEQVDHIAPRVVPGNLPSLYQCHVVDVPASGSTVPVGLQHKGEEDTFLLQVHRHNHPSPFSRRLVRAVPFGQYQHRLSRRLCSRPPLENISGVLAEFAEIRTNDLDAHGVLLVCQVQPLMEHQIPVIRVVGLRRRIIGRHSQVEEGRVERNHNVVLVQAVQVRSVAPAPGVGVGGSRVVTRTERCAQFPFVQRVVRHLRVPEAVPPLVDRGRVIGDQGLVPGPEPPGLRQHRRGRWIVRTFSRIPAI